jgi:hypothetical protein
MESVLQTDNKLTEMDRQVQKAMMEKKKMEELDKQTKAELDNVR